MASTTTEKVDTPELVGLRIRKQVGCRAGRLADRPLPEQQKRAIHCPDDVVPEFHGRAWVGHSSRAMRVLEERIHKREVGKPEKEVKTGGER